ncbi:hypothetical protein OE88DRAFT_1758384 [Heliocybe sulcata]|uniref:Uncharacterized protein n=1 Tax=Heliocybe sulcata TaxID=5364 RepID=A0A5C3MVE8_9AGAM|nr:hypothetical protein OE88DRAFT_1758384 [Heliocybe sulcata]
MDVWGLESSWGSGASPPLPPFRLLSIGRDGALRAAQGPASPVLVVLHGARSSQGGHSAPEVRSLKSLLDGSRAVHDTVRHLHPEDALKRTKGAALYQRVPLKGMRPTQSSAPKRKESRQDTLCRDCRKAQSMIYRRIRHHVVLQDTDVVVYPPGRPRCLLSLELHTPRNICVAVWPERLSALAEDFQSARFERGYIMNPGFKALRMHGFEQPLYEMCHHVGCGTRGARKGEWWNMEERP